MKIVPTVLGPFERRLTIARPTPPGAPASELPSSPPVVLIIEDNARFRTALARLLARAGCEALEAAEGSEGLALFRDRGADLVISDIYMPGLGGLPTIDQLRRASRALKIIAISGADGAAPLNLSERSVDLGADYFLGKPFDPMALLALVERLLGEVERLGGAAARGEGGNA